jgi:hypothetical protein
VDDPRLLARRPGFQRRDYVERASDAMFPDAGEALTEEEQRALSLGARRRFEETRADEKQKRESRIWLERLRKAEARAREQKLDVSRDLLTIQRAVVNIERRLAA